MSAKQSKKAKQAEVPQRPREVNWRIKGDMPTLFANQVLLVRNKNEMHLIFGQSAILPNGFSPGEARTIDDKQPIDVFSVAKIFLTPEIMRQTLKLLNEQMKLHDDEEKKHAK